MKTIGEMQQELRSIRDEMDKLCIRLDSLSVELVTFRDTIQNHMPYDKIYHLAEAMPRIEHPAVLLPLDAKAVYFGALLMSATLEDSITERQLLFLQRAILSDPNQSRIDFYMGRLGKIQPENIIFYLADEKLHSIRFSLLLDMLLIAQLGASCSQRTFEVISDVAAILGVRNPELQNICTAAVALLKQSCNDLPSSDASIIWQNDRFGFYLKNLSGWDKRVEAAQKNQFQAEFNRQFNTLTSNIAQPIGCTYSSQRTLAIKLPDYQVTSFFWVASHKEYVYRGQEIAKFFPNMDYYNSLWDKYGKGVGTSDGWIHVYAPCEGTLFLFRQNGIYFAVISQFEDNEDVVKQYLFS